MVRYFKIFILFSILILLTFCEKEIEIESKIYPYVLTNEVTDIDPSGARFNANLIASGDEQITDLGFMWREKNIENSIFVLDTLVIGGVGYTFQSSIIYSPENREDFTYRVSSDLKENREYTCRGYVRTSNYFVLGNEITFKSMGSQLPIIEKISPEEGYPGQEITLFGKHFSHNYINNKIIVGELEAKITYSNRDSIVFVVPNSPFVGDKDLILTVNAHSVTAKSKFEVLGSSIKSISANSAHSGNYVTIELENFSLDTDSIFVYFNQYQSEIVSIDANIIEVIVPAPHENFLSNNAYSISVINGNQTAYYEEEFIIQKSWDVKQGNAFLGHWQYKAFVYQDKGYVLDYASAGLHEYDPLSDQWNVIASYPGELIPGNLILVHDNTVLFIGSDTVSDNWSYNFENSTWAKQNDIPFSYNTATKFILNDEVFIVTGRKQCWKYTRENGVFIRLNDFPVEFDYFASSFLSNGIAYVTLQETSWQYNSQNDTWHEKSANPFKAESYTNAIGFAHKDMGFVLYHGMYLYRYDSDRDTWVMTSINWGGEERVNQVAFTIGDYVYIANTMSFMPDQNYLMFSYQFNSLKK